MRDGKIETSIVTCVIRMYVIRKRDTILLRDSYVFLKRKLYLQTYIYIYISLSNGVWFINTKYHKYFDVINIYYISEE